MQPISPIVHRSPSYLIYPDFTILPLLIYFKHFKPYAIQQRTVNCFIPLYLTPLALYRIDYSKSAVGTSFSCSLFLFVYHVCILHLPYNNKMKFLFLTTILRHSHCIVSRTHTVPFVLHPLDLFLYFLSEHYCHCRSTILSIPPHSISKHTTSCIIAHGHSDSAQFR